VFYERVNWSSAKDKCESFGLNMATFDSKDEAVYFNKVAGKGTWVGISDREKEGLFVKVTDGKTVDLPWDEGEPNNGKGKEHCVESVYGKNFNDNDCDFEFAYGCERVHINEDSMFIDDDEEGVDECF
jgi:Lectin C-type domain